METKELLELVVCELLEKSRDEDLPEAQKKQIFEEAMKATDRYIEVSKMETKRIVEIGKMETTRSVELSKIESDKEKKLNQALKYVELIGIPVALMAVDFAFKMRYTKTVCNFEKDYTFTTQAGRSISQFFRFKK